MSGFEIGPCTLEEYEAHQVDRVSQAQLRPQELYHVMFALRGATYEAAKCPARVMEVTELPQGLTRVNFNLLTPDLHEDMAVRGKLRNDMLQGPSIAPQVISAHRVVSGYFTDYYGACEMERGLQEITAVRA